MKLMIVLVLMKNHLFRKNKIAVHFIGILTISICLSIVFTKQHAFIDGIFSIPLCLLFYYLYKNIDSIKIMFLNLGICLISKIFITKFCDFIFHHYVIQV